MCCFRRGIVDGSHEESASHQAYSVSTVSIKSSLIDRVATFLDNPSETSTNTATNNKTLRPRITESEFSSWRESVRACSHVAQLYLVVRKVSKSRPGAQFRGMKRCLAELKALKAVRNTGKNRSCRRRDNMELLQRGTAIVEKFLDTNREECIKVGRWFTSCGCAFFSTDCIVYACMAYARNRVTNCLETLKCQGFNNCH